MRQASVEHPDRPHHLVRQESIHDAEAESSYLSPHVEGRIFILTEEVIQTFLYTINVFRLFKLSAFMFRFLNSVYS